MESKTDITFDDEEEGELVNWKVIDGAYVSADSVLLIYDGESGEKKSLKSSVSGVVTVDTTITKGKKLKKGMIVANLRPCTHAIVIKDMCASCGKDLRGKPGTSGDFIEASTANVSMIHHVPELIVSDELARKIGNRDRELLLKAHKLVLLVDLDQTLIHTTNHTFKVDKDTGVLHYKLKGTDFYTKIRPYAREFLRRMVEMYEMHIISYGERQYAHRIAEFLDPDKIYFGHRILSRDELFCAMYKTRNMQALFPCGDHMIVMIDDRPDVWQYSDALIQVKPYRFFKEIGDINASRFEKGEPVHSSSYAEQDVESEDDETLEYIAIVLTKVHRAFYELFDDSKVNRFPDLKGIISYFRKQVLRDCSIVFSGIVPVGVDIKKTEAYRLCVQFGAVVTDNVSNSTTHVIAARWGTTKVHEANKLPNISIVNPKWLFACVERWEKADEKEFELLKDEARGTERLQGSTIVVDEISRLPTLGKEALSLMTDEVDEALSEDASDDDDENLEETSLTSLSSREETVVKRKCEANDDESGASSSKKHAVEKEEENESEKSSFSRESESDDDDMAADVERQFFAM
uniref:RNA polymerase II subunit A C-terminal domain phosphatase n=1 Tax=Elaeophora elaphi TaxID=1147741 RepID=A0A158Q8S8_9BILA